MTRGTLSTGVSPRFDPDRASGRGSNILRKELEMSLIFQLGTVQPDGLNINFKFV